jgi:hypothetical protein
LQETSRVNALRVARDFCGLQFDPGIGCLVRHHAVVQKIPQSSLWRGRGGGARQHRLDSWRGHREIAYIGHAELLRLGYAINQCWQQQRGLVQVELKKLPLCEGSHRFRFSKLGDKRRVRWHRHTYEALVDGDTVNMEGRLTIKRQINRKGLPGGEAPFFMCEP